MFLRRLELSSCLQRVVGLGQLSTMMWAPMAVTGRRTFTVNTAHMVYGSTSGTLTRLSLLAVATVFLYAWFVLPIKSL